MYSGWVAFVFSSLVWGGISFVQHASDTYVGCFPKTSFPVRYDYKSYVDASSQRPMTVQECSDFCRMISGSRFSLLENAKLCSCSPFMGHQPQDEGLVGCDKACEGNVDEICGGYDTLSVYSVDFCEVNAQCPQKVVPLDFSNYDADCRGGATHKRFRTSGSFKGQFVDLIVEYVERGVPVVTDEIDAVKGIGPYVDIALESNSHLAVKIYVVISGTDKKVTLPTLMITIFDIGGEAGGEEVVATDFESYRVGSSVVSTETNVEGKLGMKFTSGASQDVQNPSSRPLTDVQKSHSATIEFVKKESVELTFAAGRSGGKRHFFFGATTKVSQFPCSSSSIEHGTRPISIEHGTGKTGKSDGSGTTGKSGGSGKTGKSGGTGRTGKSSGTGTSVELGTGPTGKSGTPTLMPPITSSPTPSGETGAGKSGGSGATGKSGGSGTTGKSGGSGKTGKSGGSGKTGKSGGTGKTGKSGGTGETGKSGGTGRTGKSGGTRTSVELGTGPTEKSGTPTLMPPITSSPTPSGKTGTGKSGGSGTTGKSGGTGQRGKRGGKGKKGKRGGKGKIGKRGGTGKTGKSGSTGTSVELGTGPTGKSGTPTPMPPITSSPTPSGETGAGKSGGSGTTGKSGGSGTTGKSGGKGQRGKRGGKGKKGKRGGKGKIGKGGGKGKKGKR